MPRNITVTFDDGSTHVYQNAPDDLTPEQVGARAQKDFGKSVTGLDGGKKPNATELQQPKEATLLDRAGQLASGVNRGLVSLAGLPVDFAANIKDLTKAGVGSAMGLAGIPEQYRPEVGNRADEVGSGAWMLKKLAQTQAAPAITAYGPDDATSRVLQSMGSGIAAGAVSPANALRSLVAGGSSGAIGQTAKEMGAPDSVAILSAILGPQAIASAGRRVGGTARALVDPFTNAGQDRIAQNVIRKFAEDGPTNINAQQIVPGSSPTLAEATGNAGIAGLQRNVRDTMSNRFNEREQANAQARTNEFERIAGDRNSITSAERARDTATGPMRNQAFRNTADADPSNVVRIIDIILAGPSGRRDAVTSTLNNIRGKIVDADGNVESSAANLYGVRKQIGDMLDTRAALSNPAASQATRELMAVRSQLDRAIERAAPGFEAYRRAYAQGSAPANAMERFQSLNLTDAQGNITLNKVQNAIRGIERDRGARGANDAKSITPEDLSALTAIRDDLLRQSNSQAGRSVGSPTRQNLATDNILANALPGKLGELSVPSNVLGQLGKLVYSGPNEQIRNRLADILLNPSQARLNTQSATTRPVNALPATLSQILQER